MYNYINICYVCCCFLCQAFATLARDIKNKMDKKNVSIFQMCRFKLIQVVFSYSYL